MSTQEDLVVKWQSQIPKRIIDAFLQVPREQFVLPWQKSFAYQDTALPILAGQTISQPTTVVHMLSYLDVNPNHKVLEVGTGSGYNAALLSVLAKEVYTIEYHKELAEFAKKNLEACDIRNVHVIHGNGFYGLSQYAPFDRIVITAACPSIPAPLIEQLAVGGVLLVPVNEGAAQRLTRVNKTTTGLIKEHFELFCSLAWR